MADPPLGFIDMIVSPASVNSHGDTWTATVTGTGQPPPTGNWYVEDAVVMQGYADQLRSTMHGAIHDYGYPVTAIADQIAPAIIVEPEPEETVMIEIPVSLATARPTDVDAMAAITAIAAAAYAETLPPPPPFEQTPGEPTVPEAEPIFIDDATRDEMGRIPSPVLGAPVVVVPGEAPE